MIRDTEGVCSCEDTGKTTFTPSSILGSGYTVPHVTAKLECAGDKNKYVEPNIHKCLSEVNLKRPSFVNGQLGIMIFLVFPDILTIPDHSDCPQP